MCALCSAMLIELCSELRAEIPRLALAPLELRIRSGQGGIARWGGEGGIDGMRQHIVCDMTDVWAGEG